MEVDKLTVGELKELRCLLGNASGDCQRRPPMPVGKTVFIRTVTHHLMGTVKASYEEEVELVDAAWIADDGRFMEAMKIGDFKEVEPYPDGQPVYVNRGSVIDWTPTSLKTPRVQK